MLTSLMGSSYVQYVKVRINTSADGAMLQQLDPADGIINYIELKSLYTVVANLEWNLLTSVAKQMIL